MEFALHKKIKSLLYRDHAVTVCFFTIGVDIN